MAIDKAVDSAALEAALKASADAIREKTGDTATIPWDAAKGFAEAIAAIEAGGGDVTINGLTVLSGTFAVTEDVESGYYYVPVKYGMAIPTAPYVYVFLQDGRPDNTIKHMITAVSAPYLYYGSLNIDGAVYVGSQGSGNAISSTEGTNSISGTVMTNELMIGLYTSKFPLRAGSVYGWIYMYEE